MAHGEQLSRCTAGTSADGRLTDKDNTIAQLRSDLQAAQLTLGNHAQTQSLIGALRPTPQPAYIVSSPYASYNTGTTII